MKDGLDGLAKLHVLCWLELSVHDSKWIDYMIVSIESICGVRKCCVG